MFRYLTAKNDKSGSWAHLPIFDSAFRFITLAAALSILILLVMMLAVLIYNAWPSIQRFGLKFLISTTWNPVTSEFGALTTIIGTLVSTALAMLLAVPVALGVAIFLTELSPLALRPIFGVAIELLAAIPSIIYGMWGLFVLAPFMSDYIQPFLGRYLGFLPLFQGPPMGIGMFTAGVVLAIMILPFMASIIRDVFLMTPRVIKESAYGLGATMWEVVRQIVLPYGMRGVIGGLLLGLGRAIGETMAVTFVIGNAHELSLSLFAPGNTIASTLANEFTEASDRIYLSALIELGLVLFLITFVVLGLAEWWLKKSTSGGYKA
ncbi:MAG: phosphate ABC transporter permease subunit PstC [Dissulfurimicrobium hydrothermale]|uniref:phosphate ABC transporter permease subunit PstC n=1 Tax=Dissulfurimicrobium hydrothermale TaxID=1750598 RepID=UPI003C78AD1F